jgi:sugar/nucleoside kinase (ribokinase family)
MAPAYAVYVGDVALDEYYRADYWPTIKDKALVDALPAVPGGMIANAACVAAALGMPVKFLGALNRGAITQFLLADLEKSGVDTTLVVYDDTLADSKTMIFLVGDEHTIFIPRMGLVRIDITAEQLTVLANAAYIYTTPGEIALLRCGAMTSSDIIQHCRQHGAKIVFDVDVDYIGDGDEERYKNLDIVFFNEVGYAKYRGGLDHQGAADRLLSYGLELVVVTLAEQGCVVYARGQTIRVPGVAVTVVDVTGAGDTFCSSFIYARSAGMELRAAAEFANLLAARCVGQLGARVGAVPP